MFGTSPSTTNEWLKTSRCKDGWHRLAVCDDGLAVSIQAGKYFGSFPKEDGANYYSHVEIGGVRDEDAPSYFRPFRQGSPEHRIYWMVPIHLVDAMPAEHGGIVGRA